MTAVFRDPKTYGATPWQRSMLDALGVGAVPPGTPVAAPPRAGMFGQKMFRMNQIGRAAPGTSSISDDSTLSGSFGASPGPGFPALGSELSSLDPAAQSPSAELFTHPDPIKECYGFARGLAGNTRLYGKMGAFDVVRPNTAAVIPYQFGGSRKADLKPYVRDISGQLVSSDGKSTSWFHGLTDVIDGRSPDKDIPVRDALQRRSPGQFIVEIPGGVDVGQNASVVLRHYPFILPCPTGTGL